MAIKGFILILKPQREPKTLFVCCYWYVFLVLSVFWSTKTSTTWGLNHQLIANTYYHAVDTAQ